MERGNRSYIYKDPFYYVECTLSEPINELENMTKQYTVTNQAQAETMAIRNGHYIIGSVDQYGHFSISNSPAIHLNFDTAKAEAKCLASINPGKTFVPMKLAAGFRAGGILEF